MSLGTLDQQMPVVAAERPFLSVIPCFESTEPAPLPAEWIIEGDPAPSMRILTCSDDAELMSGVWKCGAGIFNFHYDFDETVHVISGGVTVTVDGFTERLEAGSVAFFPRGVTARWEVDDHIRKYFVQRNPRRLHRVARRLGLKVSAMAGSFLG